MLVVDHPQRFDGTVTYGCFVLVTLDIAASVRGVTDETAVQAAEALPRAKCLAWINSYTSQLGSPLFYVVFMLADRSLPAPPRSFAAVPIAPNGPHPETGRAAAVPSRPFPWPDCYIHTLRTFTAPISRLYQSSEPAFMFDLAQKQHVLISSYEDLDATEDERQAAALAAGYGVPTGLRVIDHGSYGSVVEGDSESGSYVSSRSGVSERSGDRRDDVDEVRSGPATRSSSVHVPLGDAPAEIEPEPQVKEARIEVYVEVSGILEASDEFGTIDDFLSVVSRLRDIETDRAERAVTARLAHAAVSKTAAWLQGVPAAGELEDPAPAIALDEEPRTLSTDPAIARAGLSVIGSEAEGQKTESPHLRDPVLQGPGLDLLTTEVWQPEVPDTAATTQQTSPDGSFLRSHLDCDTAARAPPLAEAASPPSPNSAERKGLEADSEERTSSASAPATTKPAAEGSPRPWTPWAWLSLVFSRIRALLARWRAFI